MSGARTRGVLAALAMGAAAAGARTAGAQPVARAGGELPTARLASSLDGSTHAAVTALLADAERRGLPSEALLAKALEGVEKGAPPANVEIAVRRMLGRLEASRKALAPAVGDQEVVAGADAIAVGVPQDVLRRIRRLSPQRSTAVALGVLAQLVVRQVPVARATEAVMELVRRGAQPSQLLALDDAVRNDVASGVRPDIAVELRTRGVLAGPPGGGVPAVADGADFGAEAGGGTPRNAPPGAPAIPTGTGGVPQNAPPTPPAPPAPPTNAPPPAPPPVTPPP